MTSLHTHISAAEADPDKHRARLTDISNRLDAMEKKQGPHYLKLMASGQLLKVLWPSLKAADRQFKSIEILDVKRGPEYKLSDRLGTDAVFNGVFVPNNTLPQGQNYGVRVLWGKMAPTHPIVRIRLARFDESIVDTKTDALKIRNGDNNTAYQLTGCVADAPGRGLTGLDGTTRWIARASTGRVQQALRQLPDLVEHLDAARTATLRKLDFLKRLGLGKEPRELEDGVTIVATQNVVWLDISSGIEVFGA